MKISEYLGTLMLIYLKKIYISYDPQKAKYMTICGQKLWNGLSLKGCKILNVTVRKYIFLNILRY